MTVATDQYLLLNYKPCNITYLWGQFLQYPPQVGYKGNLLLDRLAGANIIICPPLKELGNVIEKQIRLMEEYSVKLRCLSEAIKF
jgi:hypothetical protein